MNKTEAVPYFLQAMTPIHMGVGEGPRDINLPTARERVTNYPVVYGSSVKGVLRDYAVEMQENPKKNRKLFSVFGPDSERASEARGGIIFTDAQLLALPVRSMETVFAWVTCPLVLRRLVRDLTQCDSPEIKTLLKETEALLSQEPGADSAFITAESKLSEGDEVMLEDYIFTKKDSAELTTWVKTISETLGPKGDGAFFKERFALIPDKIFSYFATYGTEIRTRVRIEDKTGTAASSGPWSEEYLPAESLLHGLIVGRDTVSYKYWDENEKGKTKAEESEPSPSKAKGNIEYLTELVPTPCVIRVGGKASVGMGRARLVLGKGGDQ